MVQAVPREGVDPALAPGERPAIPGLSSGGAFAVYVSQIRQIPLLTPARERDLARAYRETGDRRARDLLVTSNLRFVVQVARNYRSYGRRMADMVQEGNLGLLRAVERYDPTRTSASSPTRSGGSGPTSRPTSSGPGRW